MLSALGLGRRIDAVAVNPGEAHQRRTAERLKAKWFELDTGHYPMLSMSDKLCALLTE